MDYKKILLEKIKNLLNGVLSVEDFRKDYYFFELDVPNDAMTEQDTMFFADVREMLDWTDKNPDQKSRSYGWIDNSEYIEYVRQITEDFLKTRIHDWKKSNKIKDEIIKRRTLS